MPETLPDVLKAKYHLHVTPVETMNAMPCRPASLVVAASDGPAG
jgi:hypothetical protein